MSSAICSISSKSYFSSGILHTARDGTRSAFGRRRTARHASERVRETQGNSRAREDGLAGGRGRGDGGGRGGGGGEHKNSNEKRYHCRVAEYGLAVVRENLYENEGVSQLNE